MTIAKKEQIRLAKLGFDYCKKQETRGEYLLHFVFGSERAHEYIEHVTLGKDTTELEVRLLNSIND